MKSCSDVVVQEYYASKGEGAMMEVVFKYSTYYGDLKS